MFQVALTGLLTGLALIVAVGAQNAFLLRQGIRGEQVLPIVLTCLLSDVVAITAGVFGLGYGARLLRGIFARPGAWRVLDSAIAVLMGGLGVVLIAH